MTVTKKLNMNKYKTNYGKTWLPNGDIVEYTLLYNNDDKELGEHILSSLGHVLDDKVAKQLLETLRKNDVIEFKAFLQKK